MTGLKKGITISVLALQFAVPLLVLAQGAPTNLCQVVDLIAKIARVLLVVLIAVAVLFVVLAAFKYLTASGDAEKVGEANKQILYAVVAVAVGLLATAVPTVVGSILGGVEDCGTALVP